MKTTMTYHDPVLLKESVDQLVKNPDGIYVDVTFGGGGHSREILSRLSDKGRLISFDQDLDAKQNIIDDPRFQLVMSNFRYVKNQLRFMGIKQIDGLLADLGVSSHQFDTGERGFSTRFEGDLDMRMNQQQSKTAASFLMEADESDIARVFANYGELRSAKKWANKIVHERKENEIKTTTDLKNLFAGFIPDHRKNKIYAQLFQALRIEINDEMKALEELLLSTPDIIKPDGRLVLISYHSLEDRLAKRFIRSGMFEGEPEKDIYGNWYAPFKPLQSKAMTANEDEIAKNPRARSAKLRIGIRNHAEEEK
ncbi:16S rRNA (cytosine(1402)-N(4))-methyltransferase RsmH [Weeksellaceae bacterium KMM 9724]|uniref:16S rRNA (cytosine(1402)-N(4))-methyltransferase RsmH n=1 Tax=Profundicola chukchiensis TaxID=2961959 RepID=UPI00243BA702|nr:16S rRNA (cytosine(1402)-N(4))-methyltransferase RsmH [Profundicola chukchiensis]MDG4950116.1 16S rRNA (cytosine(1402)-N(4))-methyltransferase RsmH [Profundicola chukchiensis]